MGTKSVIQGKGNPRRKAKPKARLPVGDWCYPQHVVASSPLNRGIEGGLCFPKKEEETWHAQIFYRNRPFYLPLWAKKKISVAVRTKLRRGEKGLFLALETARNSLDVRARRCDRTAIPPMDIRPQPSGRTSIALVIGCPSGFISPASVLSVRKPCFHAKPAFYSMDFL